MGKFIKTTIKYDQMQPDGLMKAVKEKCLVDAMTITEAESKTLDRFSWASGETEVIDAKKSTVSEVVLSDQCENFYDVSIKFITLDEKTGKERKQTCMYLFQAEDLDDARKKVTEHMKGSVVDYVVSSVAESAISEYIE